MKDTTQYKKLLEEEKRVVEYELNAIAKKAPGQPGWEADAASDEADHADELEVADKLDIQEAHEAITLKLQLRRDGVVHALEKITNGSYGTCEKCGKSIEEKRLKANPAAATCVDCME